MEIDFQKEIERLTVAIAGSTEISDTLHSRGWMRLQAMLEEARGRCHRALERAKSADEVTAARSLARGITALLDMVNGESLKREAAIERKGEIEELLEADRAAEVTGMHGAPDGL